jgi:hypothetical protein
MKAAAAVLLVIGLGACSAYPAPEPSPVLPPPPAGASLSGADCFRTMDIRNHTVVNSQTLMVRVNRGEVYRVTMAGSCLAGTISSDPLIIRQPPGSAIVCKPIDLDIGIARSGIESRCIVESIVRASPAEVEALPRRLRP